MTGSFRTDVQFTVSGASANHTYAVFLKALRLCDMFGTATTDPQTRAFGTVTTDALGNATGFFHTYPAPRGDPAYFAPILSLTADGAPPAAANVAYRGTLTVINALVPPS